MAVTVNDVRVALNNISVSELADETIQQKIQDAEELATSMSVTSEKFVRDWAAFKSFLVSKTYTSVKIADIAVRQDLEFKAENLREIADQTLEEATGISNINVSTPMFDDRPEDPYE